MEEFSGTDKGSTEKKSIRELLSDFVKNKPTEQEEGKSESVFSKALGDIDQVANKFNAENPGAKLEVLSAEELQDKTAHETTIDVSQMLAEKALEAAALNDTYEGKLALSAFAVKINDFIKTYNRIYQTL